MKHSTTPTKVLKSAAVPTVKLKNPAPTNAFSTFVANKAANKAPKLAAPVVPVATAKPIFVRREQNGRKEYATGTIGERIWKAAEAIQAATPGTPVVASAIRLALPEVKPASVSAGLSHWRKFKGNLRIKSA